MDVFSQLAIPNGGRGPDFLGRDQRPLVTDLNCFLSSEFSEGFMLGGRGRPAMTTETVTIHNWQHQGCRLFHLWRLVTVTQQEEL